jgi:riboflavin synthase
VFTGIVTGVGRVARAEPRRGGRRLTIALPARFGRLAAGESIAVSGVCLTAVSGGTRLVADLSPETVRRTTLGKAPKGERVNLERSLRFGDRVSGHFVLGHVDGVIRLLSVSRSGNAWCFRFSIPHGLGAYVVRKGSVTLDGISLTVATRRVRDFEVAIIPQTWRRTTLPWRRRGDPLNFEADVLARYGAAGLRRRLRRAR